MSPSVAIIDIGSNSIKVLVAARAADGSIAALRVRTIDARISAGISKTDPVLGEEGMVRGLDAIRVLLADAAEFSPRQVILVATSAVRDAGNGAVFRGRVRAATGHEIRILSGDEEANLIGRGLTSDPALAGLQDFYVFDLGGGSLECLAFRGREIEQAKSFQLGCVRLTESFVGDSAAPVSSASLGQIAAHTRATLGGVRKVGTGVPPVRPDERAARPYPFEFSLPSGATAIATGGTMSTVRAIRGARDGASFENTAPTVPVAELRELLARLAPLPLAARRQIPGLPPPRADVFPAALATFIAIAEIGGFEAFTNSLYNLRYGLAAEALEA